MKNLTILDISDIKQANCITHSGIFHADEVMSTVLLCKIFPQVHLCRVPNITEDIPQNAILYDIGGGPFDHHQRNFHEVRENGILYSSFGLLWREYGMQLLSDHENAKIIFDFFDRSFVTCIDAIDNTQVELYKDGVQIITVSSVISSFNPKWNEEVNREECFLKAVNFAEVIFDNILKGVIAKVEAKAIVEQAIDASFDRIMKLEIYVPYEQFVLESANPKANQLLYVIFPSLRGGYVVSSIPDPIDRKKQRKLFPMDWAGLQGDEFAKISGVATATFCHQARFICGAKTIDDALLLAQKAIAF